MKLEFKPVVSTWEDSTGRFIITTAYPGGFCAKDLNHVNDFNEDFVHKFVDTFAEAVAWCERRS